MTKTQSLDPISPGLQRVARMAKESPELAFTTLAHHITVDLLRDAHRRTRAGGAVGIDGRTSADFEGDLDSNVQSLLDRAKSGRYQAPAVRRVLIPKGDGRTRPIGIPTHEDKVLQRAVAMVLESIYEQDFLPCSFGFRPGRSAHGALSALREGMMSMQGGWVLEADLRDFFGTLDHTHLREILRQRVRDGVVLRLIGKWLKAGVFDNGQYLRSESGTPQGGVISPMLANVYLHEVLDLWFHREVLPRLRGAAFLVRYADDFVIVFAREDDARRVYDVLPRRLGRFGLDLHPEKTRLLDFRSPRNGGREHVSFDLLGFTHYWGKSRRGLFVIWRKTAKSRFRRALRATAEWCRTYRHAPIEVQHAALCRKFRGHCAYYGLTGNARALVLFRYMMLQTWRKWLRRRSNKARKGWGWWDRLIERYPLPPARVVHSIYRAVASP
jgi:RNA-directed DNA polymerase